MGALALTDHGTTSGLIKFYKECKKQEIKPILGVEFYISEDRFLKDPNNSRSKTYHMVLLAKNIIGYHNLLKLSSLANIDGFYYKPRIDFELLEKYHEGLIGLNGCVKNVLLSRESEEELKVFCEKIKNIFGDDYYIELMPFPTENQKVANEKLLHIANNYNFKTVISCDAHYAIKKDWVFHDAIFAIRDKKLINDKKRHRYDGPHYYIRDYDDIMDIFKSYHTMIPQEVVVESLENTLKIADECNIEIDFISERIPKFDISIYDGYSNDFIEWKEKNKDKIKAFGSKTEYDEFLLYLITKNWKDRLKKISREKIQIYKDRLKYELETIFDLDFSSYFIIVQDYVNYAKNNDILVGTSRGCFLPGNIVAKKRVQMPIEKVKTGDKVLTHDRTYQKVIDKFEYQIDEKIIIITLENGKEIKCTLDHQIMTNEGFKKASELKVGDNLVGPVKNLAETKVKLPCQICGKLINTNLYSRTHNIGLYCKSCTGKKNWEINIEEKKEKASEKFKELWKNQEYADKVIKGVNDYYAKPENKGKNKIAYQNMSQEDKENTRKKICKSLKLYYSIEENLKKKKKSNQKIWAEKGEIIKQKLSIANKNLITENGYEKFGLFKNGWFVSERQNKKIYYQSSYELKFLNYLETNSEIEEFDRCKFSIELDDTGYHKHYPDFIVKNKNGDTIIYETKAKFFYDKNKKSNDIKICKTVKFCRERGWKYRILFKKDLEKINDLLHFDNKIINIKIERYKGPVYDLSVENSYNYTISGITVHNSVGGSLLAYLLKITDLDPLKYNLSFDRFLVRGRLTNPDIDLDFEESKRDKIIEYLLHKYGKYNCCKVTTFGFLKAKSAIRDAARTLGYSQEDTNAILKQIDFYKYKNMSDTLEEDIKFVVQDPKNKKLIEEHRKLFVLAYKIYDNIKSQGTHAAAFIIFDKELNDYTAVRRIDSNKEFYVSQYDMDDLKAVGVMKFDILSIRNLDTIKKVTDIVKINLEDIPLDDSEVFTSINNGDVTGVFMCETASARSVLKRFKIDNLDDLIAFNAINRTGPLLAKADEIYETNKRNPSEIKYPNEVLKEVLSSTYGCLVYQEQLMEISRKMAGFSHTDADKLRKQISAKDMAKFNEMKDMFIDGSIRLGYKKFDAIKIWHDMAGFARYAFNKSHSVGYAIIAYYTAYLKNKYPKEYLIALINTDKKENIGNIIKDFSKKGIIVEKPNINLSKKDFIIYDENKVIPGFNSINGLGGVIVDELINKQPYKDFIDFLERIDLSTINKRIIQSFIMCNIIPKNMHNMPTKMLCDEENIKSIIKYYKNQKKGEMQLFGIDLNDLCKNKITGDFDKKEIKAQEEELYTFGSI